MVRATEVLIVEDDPTFRAVIEHLLLAEGWRVRVAGCVDEALASCAAWPPDVILLDLMLPGASGLDLCRRLQAAVPCPGIVMLTARGSEDDILTGFEAGADDYIVKPCRPREVIARLQAVLRRMRGARRALAFGALTIKPEARLVYVHEREVHLTPTELSLLLTLAAEPQRVFSRLELLRDVWETHHVGYARNVDCHVTRLRHKLGEAGLHPVPIYTRHGQGYVFDGEPVALEPGGPLGEPPH